jgi:hypothetical protein
MVPKVHIYPSTQSKNRNFRKKISFQKLPVSTPSFPSPFSIMNIISFCLILVSLAHLSSTINATPLNSPQKEGVCLRCLSTYSTHSTLQNLFIKALVRARHCLISENHCTSDKDCTGSKSKVLYKNICTSITHLSPVCDERCLYGVSSENKYEFFYHSD